MATITIFDDITEQTLASISHEIAGIGEGEAVTLQICSAGGYVYYAFGIIDQFKARKLHVTAEVFGMAASAAAIIALACERVKMAPFGSIMIHSAYATDFYGNEVEPDGGVKRANDLQLEIIQARCPSYTEKDLSVETWYSAEQALKLGFVDEIIQDERNISAISKQYAARLSVDRSVKAMENEEKKVEQPCEAAVKADEIEKEPSNEDMLEKVVERLEAIEHRLAVLEGEGKKADDIAEQEGEDGVLARRKALYAKISRMASPKCAASGNHKAEAPRHSKIDLNKFLD